MQIRVISNKEEIDALSAGERVVHCAFRPNYKEVFHILDMCPKLEAIQIPRSYYDTIAESVILLLKSKRVELIEGDVQGHRKDVNMYYTVPAKVLDKIKEMKRDGVRESEIMDTVNRMYLLRPATVSYLVKTVQA
jgi:hypothetical protein